MNHSRTADERERQRVGGRCAIDIIRDARYVLLALIVAIAILSLVGLAGGPEPLGDALYGVLGVVWLVWFGLDLRGGEENGRRRVLWIGVAGACVMILGALANLVL